MENIRKEENKQIRKIMRSTTATKTSGNQQANRKTQKTLGRRNSGGNERKVSE